MRGMERLDFCVVLCDVVWCGVVRVCVLVRVVEIRHNFVLNSG